MKTFATTLIWVATVVSSIAAVDKKEAELKLPAPESWRGETISLPPEFAPDMKLKGTEVIRFAPGMFQADSDSFFSYLFVFRLEAEPELNAETIQREFLKYYRGLAKTVLRGKDVKVDFDAFKFKLTPVKPQQEAAPGSPRVSESTGELAWVEPFATQMPQKLRLEIQTWKDRGHNFMIVCVSPKPKDAAVWKQLREIRGKFHSTVETEAPSEKQGR